MSYLLAVFRSRTQTLKFYEILQRANIGCSVVNTPREASAGCGLSVKFDAADYQRVRRVYELNSNLSFAGFYKVARGVTGNVVSRI